MILVNFDQFETLQKRKKKSFNTEMKIMEILAGSSQFFVSFLSKKTSHNFACNYIST